MIRYRRGVGNAEEDELAGLSLVALVASASLGFELLQTRHSLGLYFNNVVYMTVTIALLGFGMSGVVASLLQRRVANIDRLATLCHRRPRPHYSGVHLRRQLAAGIPPRDTGTLQDDRVLLHLGGSVRVCGSRLSLSFMGHGTRIFALYFADLCASAVAAILFSLLLCPLGGEKICLALRRGGVDGIRDPRHARPA